MKCVNCNTEWVQESNKSYIFCPYCQKPLININEKFQALEDVVKYLINTYDAEIFNERLTIIRFLEEFLKDSKQIIFFVRIAYSLGIVDRFYESKNDPKEYKVNLIKNSIKQMVNEYGVSENWAEYIVYSLSLICCDESIGKETIVSTGIKAEAGDIDAKYKLAIYYFEHGDILNYKKYITQAVVENDDAKYHYGKFLYDEGNTQESEKFIMKAIFDKNIEALCWAGMHHNIFSNENKKIIDDAVKKIVTSDVELDSKSNYYLSFYYENININTAIKLCEKAYKSDATFNWKRYVYLLKLRSNEADRLTEGKVYRDIAELGNVEGFYELGRYLDSKSNTHQEMLGAIYWYNIAAESGSKEAQLQLAKIYELGDRVKKNLDKAIELYKMAASSGSEYAHNKISLTSNKCIIEKIELMVENGQTEFFDFLKYFIYENKEYIAIYDREYNGPRVFSFEEINKDGDFSIDDVNEKLEDFLLKEYVTGK